MPRTGLGRIYQRGEVWWIDYSFRGKRYRESSESTKKGVATALLKKRLGEMGRGQLVGPGAERLDFEDLAAMIEDDYVVRGLRSLRRLQEALAHLREFFGFQRALDITTDRIRAYIRHRKGEEAAGSTIRNEVNALRRAFNLAAQAERIGKVPHFPTVHIASPREGFLSDADVAAMARYMGPDLGPVVQFAAWTGWRKQEILGLQWSQVDFEDGMVRLPPGTTKSGKGREFPFNALPPLAELLRNQREKTRAMEKERGEIIPWVFHRDGREIKDLRGKWQSAAKQAGLEGYLFHDLRRSAIRNFDRAGVPRSTAMKLSGHKSEEVYRRYAISDSAALVEGVEKLARHHAGTQEGRTVIPMKEAADG